MSCGKYQYSNERAARQAISDFKRHYYTKSGQRMNRKGKKDKKPKRVYFCPECNAYHVTSTYIINSIQYFQYPKET